MPRLRAATRGSPLARLQTELVAELLGPDVTVEPVVVETAGDRQSDVPISQLGRRGVFVKEVQQAVLDGRIAQVLAVDIVLPQVAQGALAVECREDDAATIELLATIEHRPSRRAVDAERSFLAALGGGCDLPVGGYATIGGDDAVRLEGMIAALDGRVVLRADAAGADPAAVGAEVADHLLVGAGGAELLEDLRS